MLQRLTIRDFALVQNVDLAFSAGMTILLGETGAGKSIIIDALAAALGDRMSAENVRTGARKCIVEATFGDPPAQVQNLCREHELDWHEDVLVFRRELTSAGTSRCFVNDTPVPLSVARHIASPLLDFHGQHDTHGLLHVSRHRDVLDQLAGTVAMADDMRARWTALTQARAHEQDLHRRAAHADADRARLQFLLDELVGTDPQAGEDEQVTAELRKSEASEHIVAAATSARDLLYSGDHSAYDALRQARERFAELLAFAPTLREFVADIDAALTTCKEAAGALVEYSSLDEFSPERLEELRQRLVLLQRLVRKYGSLEVAIAERQRIETEITMLESMEETLEQAAAATRQAESAAQAHAKKLTKARKGVVATLSQHVQDSLHEMGMPAAIFEVKLEPDTLGPLGADNIEFLLSGNAGEAPKPLARIASGGELSRVMLAVKGALSRKGVAATMVFDEIDTGISGRIARKVGAVMRTLARQQQILCITHLAQIASLGDHFIRVEKNQSNGQTIIHADNITPEHAVQEVARLLSGSDITPAALDGARELMLGI